jgi:iron complex outermembrane receptor protein
MTQPATSARFSSISRIFALFLAVAGFSAPLACVAQAAPGENAQSPAPAGKIAPVTTTVIVHGQVQDDYLPTEVSIGNLGGMPLLTTPSSATVVTRDLLTDQFSRVLSDVVKNDASIGEDYAPVGYYGDFEIRGFTMDLATGLQINGLTIAGEQDVQLENKERVEFLKGIASIDSGVTTAGGLINYVTKRPALVKALEFSTDHRGSSYGTLDLGTLFGGQKQFGVRVNLTGEDVHPYVNDSDGVRGAAAVDGDWKLGRATTLSGDFEYQHRVQHSVAGYQLLGGTTVPTGVFPSTMLGEQPWAKPNTFDTLNTGLRLDTGIGGKGAESNWRAFVTAGLSQSLIDDNVIYPYGAAYDPVSGNQLCTTAYWFFCPDGSYEIYDYRDPGELRRDSQAEAVVEGRVKTGAVTHNLAVGGELFARSVNLPGAPPANAPSTVQDGAVYVAVGVENIFQPNIVYPDTTAAYSAGPVQLVEDNHQTALLAQDRVALPGGIQLIAGGRLDSLRDHNYSQPNPNPGPATIELVTDKKLWLPQYAATYSPRGDLTLYGNYSVMLSLGPQAPFWAGGYYLAPFFTRQAEVGVKFEPGRRVLLTSALFHMRAPFFYPKVTDSAGDLSFVSEGRETHDGVEFGAQGKAASWMRISASVAGIRAISDQTGTTSFDGKQVLNQPLWKTASFADIAVPERISLHLKDFHLLPGWSYTGRKDATRDDLVSVGGYNLFNMGARYAPGGEAGHLSLRIFADNVLNKRYWKDTGASYGDTFIHLGAPATVRLSAHWTF